jgi:glycosyltransferase involved in cell wall biosynthesis
VKITVILCTYNRCSLLRNALQSVAASILPESTEWEVLVVDNNSSDQTRELVEGFCRNYPGRFRYLLERQQGKSYALNSGIREARGEILAFMDDDVVVEPTWLKKLTSELDGKNWTGAGGRILLARNFIQPRWLRLQGPNNMGGILALFDLGDTPQQLNRPPIGTNMAFRREIFHRYGGFRTDLGPRPGSEIREEDLEFGRRLLAGGEHLRYEPAAIVFHHIAEHRLEKEYFLAFWFASGRTAIRTMSRRPNIFGIPRRFLSVVKHAAVIFPVKTGQWLLALDLQERFYRKCWVWFTVGEILELCGHSIAANKTEKKGIPGLESKRTT